MSASQIIFKLFPIIFFSVFLNAKDALGSSEKTPSLLMIKRKLAFQSQRKVSTIQILIDELTDIFELAKYKFLFRKPISLVQI